MQTMPHPITPCSGLLNIKLQPRGDVTPPGYISKVGLSANENPLGPSPKVIEKMHQHAGELHKYPNSTSATLRHTLSSFHNISPDMIVCTTGSEEAITLLIRAFAGPGDEVVYSQYSFLVFGKSTLSTGATPVVAPAPNLSIDVDSLISKVTSRTKIVVIDNPCNPIGTYIKRSEVIRLRQSLPDNVLLIIDSAYAEYMTSDDYSDGIDLVESYDNIAMTRTFSKFYGIAGLRLGWIYAPVYIIDCINKIRAPFGCNHLAQQAGVAALEDKNHQDLVLRHNSEIYTWFSNKLEKLGLNFTPSVTNFILVEFPESEGRNADAAFMSLVENGYTVYPVKGYGLSNHLRITLGLQDHMEGVVRVLDSFLNTNS